MRCCFHRLLLTVVCSSFLSVVVRAEIRFDDGNVHTLDGEVSDVVAVAGGTQLTYSGQRTYSPSDGPGIHVEDGSRLIVDDGSLACRVRDFNEICSPGVTATASFVEVRSGSILQTAGENGGSAGVSLNGSDLEVTGGSIEGDTAIRGADATIRLHDGLVSGSGERSAGIRLSSSHFEMTGGKVRAGGSDSAAAIVLTDSSGEISGGQAFAGSGYEADAIFMRGGSLTVTGGQFQVNAGFLYSYAIETMGSAQVRIMGGEWSTNAGPSALLFQGSTTAWLSGADISAKDNTGIAAVVAAVTVKEDAQLTLAGGTLSAQFNGPTFDLVVLDRGIVDIVGSEFNLPVNEPVDVLEGVVTGVWPDGTPMELEFRRTEMATIRLVTEPTGIGSPGDYNGDGLLDAADLDLQAAAMNNPNPDLGVYDENNDGLVDFADRQIWVSDLKMTWMGDADLDGQFNSRDLVTVFTAGEYESGDAANWAEGDRNGDLTFGSADLVSVFTDGGYEAGPKAAAAAVPEPSSIILVLTSLLALFGVARRSNG